MRFIAPVDRRRARGSVADVYEQIRQEFALLADRSGNSPFRAHSPCPELLAGSWSVLFETVLVDGKLCRADKEAIAAAVSRTNACPFCVETHALLAGVAGDAADQDALLKGESDAIGDSQRRALVDWAGATRSFTSGLLRQPPFDRDRAPEAIGTVVAFHYLNRIVEVLQGHVPMDVGPRLMRGAALKGVRLVARRAVQKPHQAGRTLGLLPEADLPADLAWAHPAPVIGSAWARFAAAIQRAGGVALSRDSQACVTEVLDTWDGADPALGSGWPDAVLPAGSDAGTQLGLLTALTPYRVDDAVVTEYRRDHPTDCDVVAAVAWSAFAAARRIGTVLAGSPPETSEEYRTKIERSVPGLEIGGRVADPGGQSGAELEREG